MFDQVGHELKNVNFLPNIGSLSYNHTTRAISSRPRKICVRTLTDCISTHEQSFKLKAARADTKKSTITIKSLALGPNNQTKYNIFMKHTHFYGV